MYEYCIIVELLIESVGLDCGPCAHLYVSKDENRTEISRTEPHRFLYLIQSNPHFFVRLYHFRFRFRISNVKVKSSLDIFQSFSTFLFLI
jgi:hypothetical protein